MDGAVTRDEALAHAADDRRGDAAAGLGRSRERLRRRPRGGARRPIRLAAEVGPGRRLDRGCDAAIPTRPIYELAHAVERVAAAVEAARALPFPFTLTARAENFLHGRPDLDDTIARLQAFEAAGADVLYAPGLRDLERDPDRLPALSASP